MNHRHDPTATHCLLRLLPSLEPIGTIRAHKVESPGGSYYKLARLVVLKEYRHYKFGRNLVLALHNWAKVHARNSGVTDYVKMVCHSQAVRADSAGAVGFYRKYDVIINPIWKPDLPPVILLRFGYEEQVRVVAARPYDVAHPTCQLTFIRAICSMKMVNRIRRWSPDYH